MDNTIITSELGTKHTFVSGNTYNYVDWATYQGITFKVGTKVVWFNTDEISKTGNPKRYTGKIEWLILLEDGDVQVAFNDKLGRVSIKELELPL